VIGENDPCAITHPFQGRTGAVAKVDGGLDGAVV
jgi:hypothetical protein